MNKFPKPGESTGYISQWNHGSVHIGMYVYRGESQWCQVQVKDVLVIDKSNATAKKIRYNNDLHPL